MTIDMAYEYTQYQLTPVADEQLANELIVSALNSPKYRLDNAGIRSGSNVLDTGGYAGELKNTVLSYTAGEAITLLDAVYLKTSDGLIYRTDADAAATAENFVGFALNAVSTGNVVEVQVAGEVSGFSSLTVGAPYFLSNTTGAIASSPGAYVKEIGVALAADRILIRLGPRVYSSSSSIAAGGGTTTITAGFRVNTVYCFNNGAAVANFGIYASGTNTATREGIALSTTRCWLVTAGGSGGLINNVTNTTFDLVADNTGTAHTLYFTAIG